MPESDQTVPAVPGIAALEWYEAGLVEGRAAGYGDGFKDGFTAGAAHFRQLMDARAGLTGYGNFLLPPWTDLLARAGVVA